VRQGEPTCEGPPRIRWSGPLLPSPRRHASAGLWSTPRPASDTRTPARRGGR